MRQRDGGVQDGMRSGGKIFAQCSHFALCQAPQKGAVAEHRVQQRFVADKAALGQRLFHPRGAGRIEGVRRDNKPGNAEHSAL